MITIVDIINKPTVKIYHHYYSQYDRGTIEYLHNIVYFSLVPSQYKYVVSKGTRIYFVITHFRGPCPICTVSITRKQSVNFGPCQVKHGPAIVSFQNNPSLIFIHLRLFICHSATWKKEKEKEEDEEKREKERGSRLKYPSKFWAF